MPLNTNRQKQTLGSPHKEADKQNVEPSFLAAAPGASLTYRFTYLAAAQAPDSPRFSYCRSACAQQTQIIIAKRCGTNKHVPPSSDCTTVLIEHVLCVYVALISRGMWWLWAFENIRLRIAT